VTSSRAAAPRPPRRAAAAVRTGLGAALALVTAGLVSVLVPLHWAADTVVSQQGFTRVVGTLSEDRQFQEALARTAVNRAADTLLGERSTGIAFVDRLVQDAARRAADVAAGLSSQPAYQQAWTQALIRTHEANVPADGAVADAPQHLVLELQPLLEAADGAVQQSVGVDLGLAERQGSITVPGSNTGRLVEAGTRLTGLAVPLSWAAGVLGLLALLVARHRFAVLAVLGLGTLAGLAVVWALVQEALRRAAGPLGADPLVWLVSDRVLDLLTGSLAQWMTTAAWAAGITGAVGVVGAVVVSSASRRRRRSTA
jgi:hypothetical protein